MPVLLHGVPQRLPVRVGTVEDLQFAAAIIVKPLDAPLAGRLAILENHGWLSHRRKSCRGSVIQLTSLPPLPRQPLVWFDPLPRRWQWLRLRFWCEFFGRSRQPAAE